MKEKSIFGNLQERANRGEKRCAIQRNEPSFNQYTPKTAKTILGVRTKIL